MDLPGTSTGQRRGLPAVTSVSQRLASSSPEFSEEPQLVEGRVAPGVMEHGDASKVWCPSPWGQLCNDLPINGHSGKSGKREVDVNVMRATGNTSLLPTAAPSPSVSSVASFRESGFQVLLEKDIHLDSFGQHMLFSDLKTCKRLCKNRGYGAFVISNGRVFFKQQPAQQCQEYLVDQQGCTAYINASHNISISQRHRLGKDFPTATHSEREIPYQKDGAGATTSIVHCPVFVAQDSSSRCNCQ